MAPQQFGGCQGSERREKREFWITLRTLASYIISTQACSRNVGSSKGRWRHGGEDKGNKTESSHLHDGIERILGQAEHARSGAHARIRRQQQRCSSGLQAVHQVLRGRQPGELRQSAGENMFGMFKAAAWQCEQKGGFTQRAPHTASHHRQTHPPAPPPQTARPVAPGCAVRPPTAAPAAAWAGLVAAVRERLAAAGLPALHCRHGCPDRRFFCTCSPHNRHLTAACLQTGSLPCHLSLMLCIMESWRCMDGLN